MARPRRRLARQERHAEILALLRREGTVRIATLAKAFAVTTETARRDLDELAQAGALKRTYGGGAGRSPTDEPGIGARSRARAEERARIGAAAAMGVEAGDVLMIDCGSTTSLFANALAARNLRLTALTNCLPAARALATSVHCRVILCPGDFVLREGGTYGSDAVDFIRRFKASKAYVGAGGLTAEGVTDADSLSCAIKRRDGRAGGPDDPAYRQLEIRGGAVRAGMRDHRPRCAGLRGSPAAAAGRPPEGGRVRVVVASE